MTRQPLHRARAPRGPSWLIALPLALVLVLALGWSSFWFYAAQSAQSSLAGWREREAQRGRILACGRQTIGGYPFRIEVRCTDPAAEFRDLAPPLAFAGKEALVAAQVYDPTVLIGEFSGPLTVAESGRPVTMQANWTLAQASLRGLPSPERLSIVLDHVELAQLAPDAAATVATAEHLEAHGRIAAGSTAEHPVLDLALQLQRASVPGLPALTQATDGEIVAVLFGLPDFAPKSWPVRLREIQQAGGHLDIARARFAQGDIVAVGSGNLALRPSGRLDGQINLTVAGLEQLIVLLGIDQAITQYLAQKGGGLEVDKLANRLDRIMPGLGGALRGSAGTGLEAGLNLIGEPTQLDGRRAVSLPLRFSDGAVFLGPIPIGQIAALF